MENKVKRVVQKGEEIKVGMFARYNCQECEIASINDSGLVNLKTIYYENQYSQKHGNYNAIDPTNLEIYYWQTLIS